MYMKSTIRARGENSEYKIVKAAGKIGMQLGFLNCKMDVFTCACRKKVTADRSRIWRGPSFGELHNLHTLFDGLICIDFKF